MGTDDEGLYKDLTYNIIGTLCEVHNDLGPVHKENIYHKAVAIKLDSSFRFAAFRMIFSACHSEGGTAKLSLALPKNLNIDV